MRHDVSFKQAVCRIDESTVGEGEKAKMTRDFALFDRTQTHRGRALIAPLACAVVAHSLFGCASKPPTAWTEPEITEAVPLHPVVVRKPAGAPTIPTGTFDEKGNPVSIACANCHTTKPTNPDAKLGAPLRMFHQSLAGAHGNLACSTCHNPADGFSTLRLADGKSLPYSEVMTLCSQCHGPQARDYQHGAHGGMTGYWDVKKGARARNNCVDCHAPHAPKYPTVQPARGPNDRFQTGGEHE